MTQPQFLHLINRLGFGAVPGQLQQVEKVSIESYIQSQLQPEFIPDSTDFIAKLQYLDTLPLKPGQVIRKLRELEGLGRELKLDRKSMEKIQRNFEQKIFLQATRGRFLRALESPRHLEELLVEFWYNRFNVFGRDGLNRLFFSSYEQHAIRPHVFGKFRQLLGATAKHPAMLVYLDNWLNTAPGSQGIRGNFKGLNENYARELLELHTMGVDGGYTQDDVIALARIFTGWGLPNPPLNMTDDEGFYFERDRHDFTDKVFLGKEIKGSGIAEGEKALDILARHPATAQNVAYKLAEAMVSDRPPESLVNRLAQKFLETDGNIAEVVNLLFNSAEFWQPEYYNAKFKNPYRFVVSAMRALGKEVDNFRPINGILEQLGMPLYACLTPDGYANTKDAWLTSDTMIRRSSLALPLAGGLLGRGKPVAAEKLIETLGINFSATTLEVLANSEGEIKAALIFASPEFMTY